MTNQRMRLGVLFNFNPSWMGGIIYILNVIKSLDFLEDKEKPEILLFYRPELKGFINDINYPYFAAVEWHFPSIYWGYFKSWLTLKNAFVQPILKKFEIDVLYPLHDYPIKSRTNTKLVSWYADLQHEHYPQFFSKRKIIERTFRIKLILRNCSDLVVSSQAVADDFSRFFKIRSSLKTHIFHFPSVINDLTTMEINSLLEKFKMPESYYIVSNQFHKHKNHKVLLKAIVLLKQRGEKIHLAMTGRFPEPSHSLYMQELHNLINEHDLHKQISLLGVIPRAEQLLLMKYSQAVLQPSLFEGWSTVIEDAISLQVPVIASNLEVNIEQLGPNGNYFSPHNEHELAEILSKFPKRNFKDTIYERYEERVQKSAKTLIGILGS